MTSAPQVKLRPVVREDLDRLRNWRNQPDVARWMYSDHLVGEEEHRAWFKAALGDRARRYWIVEADARPVGLVNLYDISPLNRKATWAYYLADPAVRGRGVGAFLEYWMIEHAFGDLGLSKLWCEVLAGNEAVWKLHESFGFRREAHLRQHVIKHGEPVDVIGLGLLASDWASLRQASAERLEAKGFDLSRSPINAGERTETPSVDPSSGRRA